MNQKLSDWASIAEILSGIAVVVTLIVLIAGIRENTNVLRASEFGALMREFNDFQIAQMTDADSVRVWDAYFNGYVEDLDTVDRMRLNLAVLTQWRIYESAFYSNEYGLVGDDEWGRIERSNCRNYLRAESNSLGPLLAGNLTERFHSYIVESCAD